MLHHLWSTQRNEALNKSATAYALKDKSYSRTQSLYTRISITGALNNVGYNKLRKGIYEGVELSVDENLNNHLNMLDGQKIKRGERAKMKEGRSRRSKSRYDK